MAQVGMRLRVWWAGEARWFTGTVGAARREGFDVCYDDGDVRLTNLHTALWQELPPIRRSSTERWPASEAEAVQRDWKGFPIACARPGAKLQTYGRDGMRGLGVRVAPQAKALLLPSAAGKGRTAQLLGRRLFWFEGDIFTGPNAERAAVAALAGNDGAPELIMLDAERFMAPLRGSAQLVECAASPEAANCELNVELRRNGVRWPALLQRHDIAAGKHAAHVHVRHIAHEHANEHGHVQVCHSLSGTRRSPTIPSTSARRRGRRSRHALYRSRPRSGCVSSASGSARTC